MDLRAFIDAFKERGKNGGLFPVVLAIVLVVGVFPSLVLMALMVVAAVLLLQWVFCWAAGKLRSWYEARHPRPHRRPLVIYLDKRRY